MLERARLVNPKRGPAAVELELHPAAIVQFYGRVGEVGGYRRDEFADAVSARRAYLRQVHRLTRRGYVPGAHNPEMVAAIRANREESAYRVYADWLAEQGDPRADLIQVQLAISADPRDDELRRLEGLILTEYGVQLAEPYWRAESTYTWRWGFVDSLDFESVHRGEFGWPSNWLSGVVLQPRSLPWLLLRSILRHPSGVLLRQVTERRQRPRAPQVGFVSYRVEHDLESLGDQAEIRLMREA